MQCPNCDSQLVTDSYKKIEIMRCPACQGSWFDNTEIDQLEDTVFADDEHKNTLVTNARPAERKCPVCHELMTQFKYRWEDLTLETCTKGHGFWLDQGEEKRVLQLIQQYKQTDEKRTAYEGEWDTYKSSVRTKSRFDDVISKIRLYLISIT